MEQLFSRERILLADRYFHLSDTRLADLLALSAIIAENETLLHVLNFFHELFFHNEADAALCAAHWKKEMAYLGDRQASFAALLMVSGLDHLMSFYRSRGIPEVVLHDSLNGMFSWMDQQKPNPGKTDIVAVDWLLHTMQGRLFRLGRLSYMHAPFEWKIGVAVNSETGRSVAFFPQPEALRSDGLLDGTNGLHDKAGGWQSEFEMTEDEIVLNPIHPGGYVLKKKVRLPRAMWKLALQHGCGSLDMHVPGDGKLDLDQCRDSILQAVDFFRRYFPDRPFQVLQICSWLMDAQLQELLPPESNIRRFQSEFYLFPVLIEHNEAIERVFGTDKIDISSPEDTGLRKALKRFVLDGHEPRDGTGFILPQDMNRFGQGQYLKRSSCFLDKE